MGQNLYVWFYLQRKTFTSIYAKYVKPLSARNDKNQSGKNRYQHFPYQCHKRLLINSKICHVKLDGDGRTDERTNQQTLLHLA